MRAPSLVLPAVGVALLAQAALAWRLYATTHQSYDRGDALALFAFLPSVVFASCAYMLLRSLHEWNVNRSSLQPVGSALLYFVVGAVIGLVSLWFAFVGGPHVAGFFMFWPLLLQVLLFGLARASVRKWAKQAVAQ